MASRSTRKHHRNEKNQAAEEFLSSIPLGTIAVFVPTLPRAVASGSAARGPSVRFTPSSPPPAAAPDVDALTYSHALTPSGAGVEVAGVEAASTEEPRKMERAKLLPECSFMSPPRALSRAKVGRRTARATAGRGSGGGGAGSGGGAPDSPATPVEKNSANTFTYDPTILDERTLMLELNGNEDEAARDEANATFAKAYDWLDPIPNERGQLVPGLTLSKLTRLRAVSRALWASKNWDMTTVALAFYAFERLVMKKFVYKRNRKLAMACCLLLAWKMNENESRSKSGEEVTFARTATMDDATPWLAPGGGAAHDEGAAGRVTTTSEVVDALSMAFQHPPQSIIKAEFGTFFHLDYSLHVPVSYIQNHLARLERAGGNVAAPKFFSST